MSMPVHACGSPCGGGFVRSGRPARARALGAIASMLALAAPALHANDDEWLPETGADAGRATDDSGHRIFTEVAFDRVWGDEGQVLETRANAALDGYLTVGLGAAWHGVLSGRLDYDRARSAGSDGPHVHAHTLREAFLSHGSTGGTFDIGRMTVRDGVAVGFNPSDVFRAGSLLARRTNDPARLRESRLGVVAVRGQSALAGGEWAAMVVPQIRDDRQPGWYSPRWDSVQHGRAQAYLKYTPPRWGDLYANVVWHHARGAGNTWGFNASSSLGVSTIAYLEYARTALVPLAALLQDDAAQARRGATQAAVGVSVSTAARFTTTLEYAFNDAGLDHAEWSGAWRSASPERVARARAEAAFRQDPLGRDGALLMVQRDRAFSPNDEVACLVRASLVDHSQLRWCEWRYRQARVEWSANIAHLDGPEGSEYGAGPAAWALGLKARFHVF